MLNDKEFKNWCEKNEFSEPAIKIIEDIRSGEPLRLVQNRSRNVKGKYASHKMGKTIQFESHKCELPFVHLIERDDSVLEFYDQASQIKLIYKAGKNEKVIGIFHTPDFFVLEENQAGYVECKTEEELIKLAEESPNRYVRLDGQWRCPPGEAYAEQYGFFYKIISSKEFNWVLQRNLEFLKDYYLENGPEVPAEVKEGVISLIGDNQGILLKDLIDATDSGADIIYRLLVQEELYINIDLELLCEPDRCHVYKNWQVALSYQTIMNTKKDIAFVNCVVDLEQWKEILWNGTRWTVVNVSEKLISLQANNGRITDIGREQFIKLVFDGYIRGTDDEILKVTKQKVNEMLAGAGERDHAEAMRRYKIILPYLNGEKIQESEKNYKETSRTIRNWIKSFLDAERAFGYGFIGLFPNIKNKGNRTSRFSDELILAFDSFMNENETPINQSKKVLHGKFAELCSTNGWITPSIKTFNKMVDDRPDRLRKIAGNRVAYQEEPFYYELEMTTPRHGDRAFQIGHIDHTEADVELIDTRTGENLGRPWLTILFDAYSRRVLSFYLTFKEPSIVSDMMVLRECARRFGRLPQIIVTDNGPDFRSVYFESLLACFGIDHMYRPPHAGKHGSVLERYFRTTTMQIFNNLRGNTKSMKNVRQVTKSVNPKNWAVWTLPLLYELLAEYFYEFYDERKHSTLGESPRAAFERSIYYSGERPARYINYNEDFLHMTMPPIERNKGMAKVDSVCGVKVNYFYYNSPELKELDGEQVEVRYDPWNAGVVCCYAHSHWVPCYSEFYSIFRNRSIDEIRIATEELLQLKRNYSKNEDVNARELANFIMKAEAIEKMQLQRTYIEELRPQLMLINGGKTDPVENQAEHLDQDNSRSSNLYEVDNPYDDEDVEILFNIDDED